MMATSMMPSSKVSAMMPSKAPTMMFKCSSSLMMMLEPTAMMSMMMFIPEPAHTPSIHRLHYSVTICRVWCCKIIRPVIITVIRRRAIFIYIMKMYILRHSRICLDSNPSSYFILGFIYYYYIFDVNIIIIK